MGNFKKSKEISDMIKKINAMRDQMPDTPCIRCGAVYKGQEKDFICYDCLEEERKIREEELRKRRFIQHLLELSEIPRRYKDAKFKPINSTQQKVFQYLTENFFKRDLDSATDILLFGSIGTGKTYLSCGFAIEFIKRRLVEIRYATEYQLLNLFLQKKYLQFENFRDAKVLIIDEIGKRELIDWQKIQLEELISHRYNEMLPTIYITNLLQSQFKAFIGERLVDRLKENSIQSFGFSGESLR
jgi:DNA replication protein DnaC